MRPNNRNIAPATYIALSCVAEAGSAGKLAKILKINRANAYRRLRVLEGKGLLRLVASENPKVRTFELTQAGEYLLSVLRKVLGNRNTSDLLKLSFAVKFRPHHVQLNFHVKELPEDLAKRLLGVGGFATSRGFMRGYELNFDGNAVFFYRNSMIVFLREMYAGNVYEAVEQCLLDGFKIARAMERKFSGLELESGFDLCRQHIAMLGGITKWIPEGFNYRTDRLVIDFSKAPLAEIETVNKTYALEDMHRIGSFLDATARGDFSMQQIAELKQQVSELSTMLAEFKKPLPFEGNRREIG